MSEGWYCPECNYGPHNPKVHGGCAICGFIPDHNASSKHQAATDFAGQPLLFSNPTLSTTYIPVPTVTSALWSLNNPERYSPPLPEIFDSGHFAAASSEPTWISQLPISQLGLTIGVGQLPKDSTHPRYPDVIMGTSVVTLASSR